jgi:hypothetical protein
VKQDQTGGKTTGSELGAEEASPFPIPTPPSPHTPASGLYEYRLPVGLPLPPREAAVDDEATLLPRPPFFSRERLRLDVDGWYPQMEVSGTVYSGFATSVHWIAELQPAGPSRYKGSIWYKDGATAGFPYTNVDVHVTGGPFPSTRNVVARFTGGGATPRTRVFRFRSPSFHDVNLEFDFQDGLTPTLSYDTSSHPNRPAGLPSETLSVVEVFRRAGFGVSTSPGAHVPLTGAQADALWSNMEMHDAMQTYWSRYMPAEQWALWVFTAGRHEWGTGLGGIMFDDIGTEHRQGTAIFNDSFISDEPAGDPAPAASVNRLRFWTTVHESGHAFNLAHAWQKSLIHMGHGPWIPLADDAEARSYMNYPYGVSGGEASFFGDFEFRFVDDELLFLRHAPERFVRQGDALWFDHHGFQQANTSPASTFSLEVRVNREPTVFEFLEPVTVELKLTNTSSRPQVVDQLSLMPDGSITVVTKREGQPARLLMPFATFCQQPQLRVLQPGESTYEPLQASASPAGWGIAEPGAYTIQAALSLPSGEDVVSKPLRIRVAAPGDTDEERVAGDFFSNEVARALAFGGTRSMTHAVRTLQDVAERLDGRNVAVHANLALGRSVANEHKSIAEDPNDARHPLGIKVEAPAFEEAKGRLEEALAGDPNRAAGSLGHIRYRRRAEALGRWLARNGEEDAAYRQVDVAIETLAAREVRGRPVRPEALDEMRATRDSLRPKTRKGGKKE